MIRFRGALSDRAREIAILTVAAHRQCRFEQHAHERIARRLGLTDAEITALRQGTEPQLTEPHEAAVAVVTRQLLTRRTLTDTDYAHAATALGPAMLFELTTLVGYYDLLALQMRVFAVS